MIGRYTMGALEGGLRLEEWETGAAQRSALSARDDFEDAELLAVGDDFGDRDRRGATQHDHGVRPLAVRPEDVFHRRPRARELDAPCRLVEPAADGDFGRNPSCLRGGKRLKRKLDFKASPASQAQIFCRGSLAR